MKYGWFDDQNLEYVINRPDTPLPWINYLGAEAYFGIISNTAGGYSFYRDARLRRLTRYRYNNVPSDSGGRYIYLRDNETGDYWSPSWQPVRRQVDNYSCRHGLGYSIIGSTFTQIKAETCYFVPLGENLEIWQLQVSNTRNTRAKLSIFASIEFCLWDAWDDITNNQRNFNTGEVEIEDGIIYHKTEYRERRNHFAYFACSEKTTGYDTQREVFLGPYRDWGEPLVVERGECTNSVAHGWAPMGVQHIQLELEAGEKREVIFVLGYAENDKNNKFDPPTSQRINKRLVKPIIERMLKPQHVKTSFDALRSYWENLLGILQVNTPDPHTNRMVNIWNAYQNVVTFNISRSASGYETGIGRGIGFRDSNQDILGFVHMLPDRTRERILHLAATQLLTGGAYHQYQPLTKQGNDAVGSNFNDDPLWLVLSTSIYIKETGNWSILDEMVPYDNKPGSEESLFNHLHRALCYIIERLGPHGLPLIGRADWNDCLNLNCFSTEPGESFQTTTNQDGKVAESVVIAALFVMAAREMIDLSRARGLKEECQEYQKHLEKMNAVINEYGWDGDWFLRAYNNDGQVIGSKQCEEGKIFIEPQGLCIMAGVGLDNGRAAKALTAVQNQLATQHGILLQQPAYSHYYLQLGEISTYPPGYKENGGIFCHTNPWVMIAETRLGNGNQAFDYYSRINPSVREEISEIHRCEPFAYAQMIAGRDAATHGEAKNSWLTGTAAWNYVAITQWILGIRPTLNGLQVNPVIPSSWEGFSAKRYFRGVTYNISVERKGQGNLLALTVDGQPIDGDLIPIPEDKNKKEVHVRVIIK